MQRSIGTRRTVLRAFLLAFLATGPCLAQSVSSAESVVRQAVAAELNADQNDRMPWSYRDHDIQAGRDAYSAVIQTPTGDLKRLLVLNGQPLQGTAGDAEVERLRTFVSSPDAQARQRRAAEADGKQARAFLRMLPDAFDWVIEGQDAQGVLLGFKPRPGFVPPDMQSRVLAVLAGQMLVARNGNRIQSLRGTLTEEVRFGFGVFGRIEKGGTFDVERRELLPGHWQIVETHVHIGGKAMLFKTIGQQEDEIMTDWHPSTAPDLAVALKQILEITPGEGQRSRIPAAKKEL